jgi:uncharacterized protein with von Willebrand factor type A (vWA) domain
MEVRVAEVMERVMNTKARSAWKKGVVEYALDILDTLDEVIIIKDNKKIFEELKAICLNGADSWNAYSWNGCAEVYDSVIAQRLCTPSELKKTKYGERRPNSREECLDTQARALGQAFRLIYRAFWLMYREEIGIYE